MRRAFLWSALAAASIAAATATAATFVWGSAEQIGVTNFVAVAVNDEGTVAGYVMGTSLPAVLRDGTTTILPLPADAIDGSANGINNSGQVAGSVSVYDWPDRLQEAVVWGRDGTITRLGFLDGGTFSTALDMNDDGVVVGAATPEGGSMIAVRWQADGTIERLPMPEGGSGSSMAYAINASGEIVGNVGQAAVRWSGSTVSLLDPLTPGAATWAGDINAAGTVVGNGNTTADYPFTRHPIVWSGTTPTDLGSLGGSMAMASSINDDGVIVGAMSTSDDVQHAYAWVDGVPIALAALPGDERSFAKAINGNAVIVGSSGLPYPRAVAWRAPDARAMLAELVAVVAGYDLHQLGTSLEDKLATAQRQLEAGRPRQASETLDAFIRQVGAQRGKALTNEQADDLVTRAEAIQAALGY